MIRPGSVIALCCLALATISFTTAGPAMCMPALGAELHLDYARQGLVFSAIMWSAPLSVLAAAAADRIGFAGLMIAASVLQAAGWFGLAQAGNFAQAVGGAALVGVGGAVLEPLLTPMVCAVYPQQRTAKANFLHAFFCVGLGATALLILGLQLGGVPWRWTFRLLGLLCLPHGVLAAVVALPRQVHAPGTERLRARVLVRRGVFWLLAGVIFLGAMTEIGPATWLPSFLKSTSAPASRQLAAGLGLALFAALMACGRFLTGRFAERLGVYRLVALAAATCLACLGGMVLPLGVGYHIACLGLVGLAVACLWPTVMAIAGDRFPQAGASMYSILSAVGGLGCAAAPAVVGAVAQGAGALAWGLSAMALAPALVLAANAALARSGGAAASSPAGAPGRPAAGRPAARD